MDAMGSRRNRACLACQKEPVPPQTFSDEPGATATTNANTIATTTTSSQITLQNFTTVSVLFSVNHGRVVACLALATALLGGLGAWQSGLLWFKKNSRQWWPL